jgi:regulator of sigma E protease
MSSFFSTVVFFLLAITLMVWIHEMGHFLAARTFGVRVDVFSLGFGPRIVQWRWGDTYWRFSAIAFGGFTKLAGEHSHEALGDPEEYLSKPRWVRLIIASAGAASNVLVAIILLTTVFYFGDRKAAYLSRPADIGWVEEGSAAAQADIKAGDRITRIAGLRNPAWTDVQRVLGTSGNLPVDAVVLRNGRELDRTIRQRTDEWWRTRSAGWHPFMRVRIQNVVPGLPADRAGLKSGDDIVSVNGEPVRYWPRIEAILGVNPVEVVVSRDGSSRNVRVQPEPANGARRPAPQWTIGVTFENEIAVTPRSLAKSLIASFAAAWNAARLIMDYLRNMVLQQISKVPPPIAGFPVLSEEPGNQGVSGILALLSMVSVNLAICNLLPIPLLDGGVVLTLVIEIFIRRDLSPSVKEGLFKAGFILLMVILAIVLYRDISEIASTH